MALNEVTATFTGYNETRTSSLWQYDYGQVLIIDGLDLPSTFEVHFSNTRNAGETITQVGTDGEVTIPDSYLTSGQTVYAWIFLHEGEDDGETEYMITIPVRTRPEPSDDEPTPEEQSAITQTIAALNAAVEAVEDMTVSSETLAEGSSATVTKTTSDDVVNLHFGIPRGDTGATGATGATGTGIASITKTATAGLVDTYTITFTNGTTTTFDVTNGADGGGGVYIVTATIDGDTTTLDKTYAEIRTAYLGGASVIITTDDGTDIYYESVVKLCEYGEGVYGVLTVHYSYNAETADGYPYASGGK